MLTRIGIVDAKYGNHNVADKCPNCNQISEINIALYQSVFVIGFPLFPINKKREILCLTCKKEIPYHKSPKYVLNKYSELISSKKPSPWIYTFSYFIVFMTIFISIKTSIDNGKFKKYIDKPKIGDTYKIKNKRSALFGDKDYYSYIIIDSINGNYIGFKESIYESSDINNELTDIPEDEKWADELVFYNKENLKQHLNTIDKNDNIFTIENIER